MLELDKISFSVCKNSKLERKILNELNLTIKCGEFVIIIGGNGAGKSTTLNVISGLIRPDSGLLRLNGKDITKQPQHMRSSVVAKVMQDPKLGTMENMTISQNMAFAYKRGAIRGMTPYSTMIRRQHFADKLSMLEMGLEERLDELVLNLSGGQRQALSLIMGITAQSEILLLDEITSALDPKMAATVMRIAARVIGQSKTTTIMITHNMSHAIEYGDRTVLLGDGKIIREFTKTDKLNLTSSDLTGIFIEG